MGWMLWIIGFLLVIVGVVIRGPALGMGLTIENIHWEGATLEFEFNGQGYQQYLPEAGNTAVIVEMMPSYTEAKAEWDSILLEGQGLKVTAADGKVIYQTTTTELRLQRPLVGNLSVGWTAAWMVRLGVAGSVIGPLLSMTRRQWYISVIWLVITAAYLL